MPGTYSFRATWLGATETVSASVTDGSVVTFATGRVTLRALDSAGDPLGPGLALSYNGGGSWHALGTTGPDGTFAVELVPGSYSFRATWLGATETVSASVTDGSVVTFATGRVTLRALDSAGDPLGPGLALSYNGGGSWHALGTTGPDGTFAVELVPGSYSFRATWLGATETVSASVTDGSVVTFATGRVTLRALDSAGDPLGPGLALSYNGGGSWHALGTTGPDGTFAVELVPGSYSFRATWLGATETVSASVTDGSVVTFATGRVTLRALDSAGDPLGPGLALSYNGGGSWHALGTTGPDGTFAVELVPGSYSFRATWLGATETVSASVTDGSVVTFATGRVTLRALDSAGDPLGPGLALSYNGGGSWHALGTTGPDGTFAVELVPGSYSFRATWLGATETVSASVTDGSVVTFATGRVHSDSGTATAFSTGSWHTFSQDMELLPGSYTFRFSVGANAAYSIAGGAINHIR